MDILQKQLLIETEMSRNAKLLTEYKASNITKSKKEERICFDDLRNTKKTILQNCFFTILYFLLFFAHDFMFHQVDLNFLHYYSLFVVVPALIFLFVSVLFYYIFFRFIEKDKKDEKDKKYKDFIIHFFFVLLGAFVFIPFFYCLFFMPYLSNYLSYKKNKYSFVRKHRCKYKKIRNLKKNRDLLLEEYNNNLDRIINDNQALNIILNSQDYDRFYHLKSKIKHKIENNAINDAIKNQINQNEKNQNLIINS